MMEKANTGLKTTFILFNLLLGIAGCVLLVLAILGSQYMQTHHLQQAASGLAWVYGLAVTSMILSCVGAYGGYKEHQLILRLYLGAMTGGAVSLFIFGISASNGATKLKDGLRGSNLEKIAEAMMADDQQRTNIKTLEMQFGCCGVSSYRDWEKFGPGIPDSCLCPSKEQETERCMEVHTSIRTYSYQSFGRHGDSKTMKIYQQACGPILLENIEKNMRVALGLIFGFAVTAMVGLLLALSLLSQMGQPDGTDQTRNIPYHRFT